MPINVGDHVPTPKGRATVDEIEDGMAYVTLTNGVEMDFTVAELIRLKEEQEAEEAREAEEQASRNIEQRMNRIMFGMMVMEGIQATNPALGDAITKLATTRLLNRCQATIDAYEGTNND